jgi:hypothetical protein
VRRGRCSFAPGPYRLRQPGGRSTGGEMMWDRPGSSTPHVLVARLVWFVAWLWVIRRWRAGRLGRQRPEPGRGHGSGLPAFSDRETARWGHHMGRDHRSARPAGAPPLAGGDPGAMPLPGTATARGGEYCTVGIPHVYQWDEDEKWQHLSVSTDSTRRTATAHGGSTTSLPLNKLPVGVVRSPSRGCTAPGDVGPGTSVARGMQARRGTGAAGRGP